MAEWLAQFLGDHASFKETGLMKAQQRHYSESIQVPFYLFAASGRVCRGIPPGNECTCSTSAVWFILCSEALETFKFLGFTELYDDYPF